MVRNICFRPSAIQFEQIQAYMEIHHIKEYSEAMRRIVDNWITIRIELDQLRQLLDQRLPQETGPALLKLRECPMLSRTFENIQEQQLGCNRCEKRTPETYVSCPYNTKEAKP